MSKTAKTSRWVARRSEKNRLKPRTLVRAPLGELPRISPYGDNLGRGRLFTAEFSKEKGRKVLAAIRRGLDERAAAAIVGVTTNILLGWLREGAQLIELTPDGDVSHMGQRERDLCHFVMNSQKALADFQTDNLKFIEQGRHKWWQAAAWLLERRLPKQWAKREVVKHEHEDAPQSNIDVKVLIASPEGIKAIGTIFRTLMSDQPALHALPAPQPQHIETGTKERANVASVPHDGHDKEVSLDE